MAVPPPGRQSRAVDVLKKGSSPSPRVEHLGDVAKGDKEANGVLVKTFRNDARLLPLVN